jgi:hypothetical protein
MGENQPEVKAGIYCLFKAHGIYDYESAHCTPDSGLTLCRSYLKPYCMGRKTVLFSAGI